MKTQSTPNSVKRLLRERRGFGVTFLIPSASQRPWSPPVRYQCVYETYFRDDTKLWFPIPRLVTAYARRRDAAISQFLNGLWHIAVALMVLAAEIDVSLSVRTFEELTSVSSLEDDILSIKMRPSYNVIGGHPNKALDWQRSYFFIKCDDFAFEDPPDDDYRVLWNTLLGRTLSLTPDHLTSREYPEVFLASARAVARLAQEHWENISWERVRRSIDRDWDSSYIPSVNKTKRRISLFTVEEQKKINAARKMRGLPDLSAMMAAEHGLSNAEPSVPSNDLVTDDATLASFDHRESSLGVVVVAPKKKKSKKRARDEPPVNDDLETLPEEADEPWNVSPEVPLQKKRSKQTGERGTTKRQVPPVAVSSNPGTSVPGSSTGGISVVRKTLKVEFPDRVSFEYDRPTPLIYAAHKCAELVSQIKCGPKPFLPVADLIFKDEYVDSARTKLLCDVVSNFVVEKYDSALKEALAELEKLKKTVVSKSRLLRRRKAEWQEEFERMAEKRDCAVARGKALKKRADAAEEELSVARSTIEALELRKANLMEEIGAKAVQHKKEHDRLRDSRIYEVTKERVRVETEMIAKSNKHFGNLRECRAFGTKSCLEALKAGARDIPQETIDMFAAREKQFEEEALKLDPGEIPETDLVLYPLRLDSQFVDMRAFVGLDPHGSNIRLIDPRTAGVLQSPADRPGTSAASSRSVEVDWSKTGAPALDSRAVDEGVNSFGNQDGSNVLEISDSSVSDSEDGQGRESEKADAGEEVDGVQSGEIIGDQANPSESQLEIRGGEAIARFESVDADQPVRTTLPEPPLDNDAVMQEQARDPEE
ncbi:PREDICTED: uncharacterized protein LOC106344840 [Brassica oleracea var. oleracea]|uniref:uncharacterized protein LOC106344840 n=1 Tax=Brassica oleracea var. oleracea TaxID=109376 RepID=UPI0006A6C52C|nr:PREDICTED: uncharacterized protein LOC106344840 [Brassica oleracea var. oleracea]